MSRYGMGHWVPWKYIAPDGRPTYYKGTNRPAAGVIHRMQGYAGTALEWAGAGHFGASWSFTVALDGAVYQHLEEWDGGFQAGIAEFRDDGSRNPEPTWELWRGWGPNVNEYTVGIEMEGFSGQPFPLAQQMALRNLMKWVSAVCGFPCDREHWPSHADIALIDRANDPSTPNEREKLYAFLFPPEDEVTAKEYEDLILAVFSGGEEASLTRDARLANATYRIQNIASGKADSVLSVSASAAARP